MSEGLAYDGLRTALSFVEIDDGIVDLAQVRFVAEDATEDISAFDVRVRSVRERARLSPGREFSYAIRTWE